MDQHIVEIVSDSGEGAQKCGQIRVETGSRDHHHGRRPPVEQLRRRLGVGSVPHLVVEGGELLDDGSRRTAVGLYQKDTSTGLSGTAGSVEGLDRLWICGW